LKTVIDWMVQNLSDSQAREVLELAVSGLSHFPAISELSALADSVKSRVRPNLTLVSAEEWQSPHAPGFPAALEAVMKWVDKDDTAHPAFKFAQRQLKINDEVTWRIYGEWKQGITSDYVKGREWRPSFLTPKAGRG
jgi:hypothetical protein